MKSINLSVIIRQTIVGILYLSPFWLAFVYLPHPFGILAPCLLIIKQKLPKDTDIYEIQVLAKQTVLLLTRTGTPEEQEKLDRMKKAFVFGDEVLQQTDADGASAKFLMDALFLTIEGLSIATMIAWFVITQ